MKVAKENMSSLDKCKVIREIDCRFIQSYIYKKNLLKGRMEFLWETSMIDSRTRMKVQYK